MAGGCVRTKIKKSSRRAEAVSERDRADVARAEAENNFRIAQETAKGRPRCGRPDRHHLVPARSKTKSRTFRGTPGTCCESSRGVLDNIAQNPVVDISLNDTTRAAAHDATARMYRDIGEPENAKKEFNKAIDIYQSILDKAADGPDKEVVKDNLVVALLALGQTSLLTSSQDEVRAHFDRAARLRREPQPENGGGSKEESGVRLQQFGHGDDQQEPTRPPQELYLKRSFQINGRRLPQRKAAALGRVSDDTQTALISNYMLAAGAAERLRDVTAWEDYNRRALAIASARVAAGSGDNDVGKNLGGPRPRAKSAMC